MFCSMADVLTLGQQQFSVLHYQVNQTSVTLSSNNFEEYNNPTLDSALDRQRKMLILLSLLNQSSMSAPLPLVTTLMTEYHQKWVYPCPYFRGVPPLM